MKHKIDLGKIKIPIEDYAIQGNAILGIKESGKSATATKVAEDLMDAGIPIIAVDKSGVWRWLRVGQKGHKGYPVVIAGGKNGDFPITSKTAPEIIRAARKARVSLIVDLHDRALSHAERGRIVAAITDVLLYENADWGLCHIFFEEAQRWVPQVIRGGFANDERGKVYSAVEEFCQTGGNEGVGFTLIAQRAESLNKEVLELCDLLVLGRQKGKNSLTALGKWLNVVDVSNASEISKQIPRLAAGEFFVWPSASDAPVKTLVPLKKTVHPNRRKLALQGEGKTYKPVDVRAFVTSMSKSLERVVAESKANDPMELRRQIQELERQLRARPAAAPEIKIERIDIPVLKNGQLRQAENIVGRLEKAIGRLETPLHVLREGLHKVSVVATEIGKGMLPEIESLPTGEALQEYWLNKLPQGERVILALLLKAYPNAILKEDIDKATPYKRRSRDAYLSRMAAKQLIEEPERGMVKASAFLF